MPPHGNEPADAKSKQVLVAVVASLGSMLMGISVSWSGAAITLLKQEHRKPNTTDFLRWAIGFEGGGDAIDLTDAEISWIASLMPVGACVGSLLASQVNDRFGRKTALLAYSILFAVAYTILTAANSVGLIYVGRVLSGLVSGLTTATIPLYLSEVAQPNLRGLVGSIFQTMVTVGILAVDLIAYVSGSWRWMSALTVAASLLWTLLLLRLPESPIFMLSHHHTEESVRQSLARLRSPLHMWGGSSEDDVDFSALLDSELDSMKDTISNVATPVERVGCLTYVAMYFAPCSTRLASNQAHLKWPMTVAYILMIGQQLTGINAVLFYSVEIFEAAGTNIDSFLENTCIGAILLLGTLVSSFQVDKWGRRPLLIISLIGIIVANYGLGAYFWLIRGAKAAHSASALPLISLTLFILSFSVGMGPVPWLMAGEIFPLANKNQVSAVAASVNWFAAILVTKFFPYIVVFAGQAAAFWTFGFCAATILALAIKFVPETKGLALSEISDIFNDRAVVRISESS